MYIIFLNSTMLAPKIWMTSLFLDVRLGNPFSRADSIVSGIVEVSLANRRKVQYEVMAPDSPGPNT